MKLIVASTLALAMATTVAQPRTALAWGCDGHRVVVLIAQSSLDADVRRRVNAFARGRHGLPDGARHRQRGDLC